MTLDYFLTNLSAMIDDITRGLRAIAYWCWRVLGEAAR
jgi:hypothetical protein